MTMTGPLVTTEWLGTHLGQPNVKCVDASWRMPGEPPAISAYEKEHIPSAVFFDLDAISDRNSPLPHMQPSAQDFEQAVGALGVSSDDTVIVYDDQGLFSAARVWWCFKQMGHERVAVLDGGLPKWIAEGRPTDDAPVNLRSCQYRAHPKPEMIATADDVRAIFSSDKALVFDARPPARFYGETPEPRTGLRRGAMPGAVNIPFGSLLNDDRTMLSSPELKKLFSEAGLNANKQAITTCGSGVTAAIISLALEVIGHEQSSLYDGSWVEWADIKNSLEEFPVIAGA